MMLALCIVSITIDEVKLSREVQEIEAAHPEWILTETNEEGKVELPKDVKKSLVFLLISVALWFIAYNALETWFTTFANVEWGMALGSANTCLTIATGGAIITYVPSGVLASRIGRKKTILVGIAVMALCLVFSFVFYLSFHGVFAGKETILFYVLLFIIGMGRAFVTPILAGALLRYVGYWVFFPYTCVFMIFAFVTMQYVKHGDTKDVRRKGFMETMAELED